MLRTSRRAVVAGLLLSGFAPAGRSRPTMILHNGRIWTGDPATPSAQALALVGDRIVAVGDSREVLALAGPATRKVDLGGKRVTPGFNDAHCHLAAAGVDLMRSVACDLIDIDAIVARLRDRAAKTAPGTAIIGFLYDDGKTPRPLSRADLDAVSTRHPVLVQHRGGHTMFVNSRAFAAAGVNDKTPDPKAGRFGRDARGRLSGLVVDRASAPFDKLFPGPPSPDDMRKGVAQASRMFAAKGITSICDAAGDPGSLAGYVDARRAGELSTRVYCHIWHASVDKYFDAGVRTGFGDAMVRIGAVKLMADGSISERSALLSQPYHGRGDYRGVQVQTPEEMYPIARKAHTAGWQLGIHANGDVAIDQVLTLFERLQRENPRRDPRFRIEHCTVLNDDLIRRIKAIGALPILFGGYVYFHGDVMNFYGEERLRNMFALRSLLDAGVRAASSSDYTASPPDPMMWLRSEVTRTDGTGHQWGFNQRVTVEEAIRSGTSAGAFASFEDGDKGVLSPGMFADLAVWESDPLAAAPGALLDIKVERTMTGGRWVYES